MVDPELEMIFFFVVIMATIALIMAQLFHRRTVKHAERKLELEARIAEAGKASGETDQAAHRKLEERVRVLERIATDGKQDLALQIESLRDLQEIDDLTTLSADRQEAAR